MKLVPIKQEEVAKIDGEELYVFPDKLSHLDARTVINSSMRGTGLSTVVAHKTKDRYGDIVYLNSYQIKQFELIMVPVPTDVSDNFAILVEKDEDKESPEYIEAYRVISNYFEIK